jgi:F0F1-type ATP synthase assembly protein I
MPNDPLHEPNAYRDYAQYSAIGFQIAAGFALLTLGGNWLDEKFSTRPLFLLIGLAFALISMVVLILKMIRMLNHKNGDKINQ